MIEKKLTISDAAKQLSLEAHVLRYWEMELGLNIARNAQGHRFYEQEDMQLLKQIKYLKEQGFRLQAIKLLLPDISKTYTMDKEALWELRDHLNGQVQQEEMSYLPEKHMGQIMQFHPQASVSAKPSSFKPAAYDYQQTEEKLKQFESMMRKMIQSTLEEMAMESEERICDKVSTRILKEMDYLQRQKEELQEKQLALLQDILTEIKKEGTEAAATEAPAKRLSRKERRKERKKKLLEQ